MTFFDTHLFSEIKEPGWDYTTLRPPLTPKEILIDFKIQWNLYSFHNLGFFKRVEFMVLRVFQRVAYNLGWMVSSLKFKKTIQKFEG